MNERSVVVNVKARQIMVALMIIAALLPGMLVGCSPSLKSSSGNVLAYDLREPLGDVTTAKYDFNVSTGHLTIEGLTDSEPLLAGGRLEYLENEEQIDRTVVTFNGQATVTLESSDTQQSGIDFPWEACSVKTEWQIQLNPGVLSDITAYSGGGNVRLDLAGLAVSRLAAETSGGNMDVVLPDNAAGLSATLKTGGGDVYVEIGSGMTGSNTVTASSGAGNVEVRVPDGIAARIHAESGLSNVIVDSQFSKIDDATFQSPDYDSAADKVEIFIKSGAGNVSVTIK